MNLRTVSELFKNAPVHLRGLCNLQLWWEQFLPELRKFYQHFLFSIKPKHSFNEMTEFYGHTIF